MTNSKIIVALDFPNVTFADNFVDDIDPKLCKVKVGKELFTKGGPAVVERYVEAGFDVFLDLKFHDIPNTVAAACRAAADLGVWMVNIHASGGRKMMEAAANAIQNHPHNHPKLVAVTVLTSMGSGDLLEVGVTGTPSAQVSRLAALAEASGCDGVVCSAQEAKMLRSERGSDFLLVTPGIRPVSSDPNDQRRITTPQQAVDYGSNYLVVGRPVTQAPTPAEALRTLFDET